MSEQYFQINSPGVVAETFGRETVVINFKSGTYYNLAGTSSEIWSRLQDCDLPSLVEELIRSYSGDPDLVDRSVRQFVEQLTAEGLIVPRVTDESPAPATGVPPPQCGEVPFEPPKFEKYDDMQDMLLLDPVHDVDETTGWPVRGH